VSVLRALGKQTDERALSEKIDGVGALVVALEKMLREEKEKVVLVLDGVDRGRAVGGMLGGLGRLGDTVSPDNIVVGCSMLTTLDLQSLCRHDIELSEASAVISCGRAVFALPSLQQGGDGASCHEGGSATA
jgi:hypothetical protein